MPHTPYDIRIDLQEADTRNRIACQITAGLRVEFPTLGLVWRLIDSALADTPILSAEIARLRAELADIGRDRANLTAAARATITADHDGEDDPLFYLRDELQARGQLPDNARGRA